MDFDSFSRHCSVSRETYNKFTLYHDLLLKWQSSINLVSRETIGDIWQRHFLDSAQLFPFIDDPAFSLLDIGSGAGFPGIVLSILGAEQVSLVESDQRKSIFLQEVARTLSLDVTIHNRRIEMLAPQSYDIITARACAPLSQLFSWAYPFCHEDSICLFPKGKNYAKEWEECASTWQGIMQTHPSKTHSDGVILHISHLVEREK